MFLFLDLKQMTKVVIFFCRHAFHTDCLNIMVRFILDSQLHINYPFLVYHRKPARFVTPWLWNLERWFMKSKRKRKIWKLIEITHVLGIVLIWNIIAQNGYSFLWIVLHTLFLIYQWFLLNVHVGLCWSQKVRIPMSLRLTFPFLISVHWP